MSGTRSGAPLTWRGRLASSATLATSAVSRRLRLGSGSVIGGRVGLALDPRLLERAGAGRRIVLVTGTNGKTTTTRLLVSALGGTDKVASNSVGSNLPAGLVSALVSSPSGQHAVLEVDEGYLGQVAEALAPAVVLLLNLSRDQLDRVSEVRMLASRLRGALASLPHTLVVANADDPLVVWAAKAASSVRWVGAGQLWRSDAMGCPACDGPLHFDSPGPGWSSDCGLCRPDTEYELVDHEVRGPGGDAVTMSLSLPGRFNRANAALALVAAGEAGVNLQDAARSMSLVSDVEGRFSVARHGSVEARLLLAKNPAGFAELLALIDDSETPVVIGINARVADGHDPSWLWDVAFERLAGRQVVATGERAADLGVRLRYAGVSHVVVPDQLDALGASGEPHVQYIGNYTAFQDLRRLLAASASTPSSGSVDPSVEFPPARTVPVAHVGGAPKTSALRVLVVHPDLLGTYGDSGNGYVLAARASWRDIDVELVLASSTHSLPASGDIYCLGGGEDGPEVLAAERLSDGALRRAVDGGAVVLAVCAGYQVVGTSFPDAAGTVRPGLGLIDVVSVKGTGTRAVGELLATPLLAGLGALTGFENHGGVTQRGAGVTPLGTTVHGVGNGDGTEGAVSGNVFGTYMHGPVLARNPALADLLLARAIGSVLGELDDAEERTLHAERVAACETRSWGRVGASRRKGRVGVRGTRR